MADFDEVRLDVCYSYGAVGGPMFKTTIITLNSGHEQRNMDWEDTRAEYDISYTIKNQAEIDALRAFFYARRGRATGFRYKDATDFKLPQENIGLTDGVQAIFQIFKRYTDVGSFTYDRDITKIVADVDSDFLPLIVTVNAVTITEGAGAAEFQIDRNTGLITLGATHAATSGQVVTVECEFDVPVRFDTDHLQINIIEFNAHNWSAIPLVEVRDIT